MGMGGSSLAPEVFQETFGNAPGYAKLRVLDSTHPGSVRAVERDIELTQTIFLVSSKSGTTTETVAAMTKFRKLGGRAVWSITCYPDTPVGRETDLLLSTEMAPITVKGKHRADPLQGSTRVRVPQGLPGDRDHRLRPAAHRPGSDDRAGP
ncbi:MAG: hypothetical protein HC933_05270, partial [Pleurocapsa sp. SU_196_0]|nr:hypothetical protein [Pleurocapsa sp. SU_196_0]